MEDESIIEIINEAVIKTEATELILTQKLILDACTCTGNCPKY